MTHSFEISTAVLILYLTELTKQGSIIRLGAGRAIKYRWNWEQEDEQ